MATMLFAGMTSCNNDDDVKNAAVKNTIGFNVNGNYALATRGVATEAANATAQIASFQAWAYDDTTDDIYMGTSATAGRVVSNTGTAVAPVWSYSPVQFWPVNPLNFVAVTPATAPTGGTLTHSTASADNVVTITSTFVNPTDVENQVDIMYASADDIESTDNAGNVPFTFKHALSQIVFKGKFNDDGAITKATIAEITLGNVKSAATLVYTSTDAFYGSAAQPATSGTQTVFTLDSGDLEGSVWEIGDNATANVPFDLTVSDNATKKNAWMMVPQTISAWDGTTVDGSGVPNDGGAYIKLRVKLEKDGVVIKDNQAADAIYLPLAITWNRSTKYIYTIEFNGENALTPITFSVAAQNWTPADPQPADIDY